MQCRKNSLLRHGPATNRRPFQRRTPSFLADRKGLLCALILIAPIAQASADVETSTIRIEKLDMGNAHRGRNKFSAAVQNKSDSVLTLVLDLRADPGLWLRKSQRQFVYLLQSGARQVIDAEYEFIHMSPEAFLRVQFYFPIVAATGVTELSKPFFEQVYPVGVGNKDVDYDLSQFHKREGRHFLIYYFPDSLAAHEVDRIVEERDRGFEKIANVLGVSPERKIRLFLSRMENRRRKRRGTMGRVGRLAIMSSRSTTRRRSSTRTTKLLTSFPSNSGRLRRCSTKASPSTFPSFSAGMPFGNWVRLEKHVIKPLWRSAPRETSSPWSGYYLLTRLDRSLPTPQRPIPRRVPLCGFS